MAFIMKTKYDTYWGNLEKINRLLFINAILEMWYKLITQVYWFNQVVDIKKGENLLKFSRGI